MSKRTGKQMKNLPHNYINAMNLLQEDNEKLRKENEELKSKINEK